MWYLGCITPRNFERFFGVTDTVNGDTTDTNGQVQAQWVFDVSGASGLNLSIDMGASNQAVGSYQADWLSVEKVDVANLLLVFMGAGDDLFFIGDSHVGGDALFDLGSLRSFPVGALTIGMSTVAAGLFLAFACGVVFSTFLKVQPPRGDPSGLKSFVMFLVCGLLPYRFLSESMSASVEAVGKASPSTQKGVAG